MMNISKHLNPRLKNLKTHNQMAHYEKNQEKRDQLRSEFAGLAMQGLLSCDQGDSIQTITNVLGIESSKDYDYLHHYPIYVAKRSIAYADALLNELEKTQP